MKKIYLLLFLGFLLSCENPDSDPKIDEAKKQRIISYMGMSDVRIVDIRPPQYTEAPYNASVIRYPLSNDYGTTALEAILGMDKNVPIVVYCAARGPADDAAKRIRSAGYTRVEDAGSLADLRDIMNGK